MCYVSDFTLLPSFTLASILRPDRVAINGFTLCIHFLKSPCLLHAIAKGAKVGPPSPLLFLSFSLSWCWCSGEIHFLKSSTIIQKETFTFLLSPDQVSIKCNKGYNSDIGKVKFLLCVLYQWLSPVSFSLSLCVSSSFNVNKCNLKKKEKAGNWATGSVAESLFNYNSLYKSRIVNCILTILLCHSLGTLKKRTWTICTKAICALTNIPTKGRERVISALVFPFLRPHYSHTVNLLGQSGQFKFSPLLFTRKPMEWGTEQIVYTK